MSSDDAIAPLLADTDAAVGHPTGHIEVDGVTELNMATTDSGVESAVRATKSDVAEMKNEEESKSSRALVISFVLMTVVGLGNKIFQVLQMRPMRNYPLFVNLLTTAVYIPVSFAYIFPMIKWGTLITPEQEAVPKYKFAVMGLLDSIAGVMQVTGVNYVANGSLIILLMQSAVPFSMVISRFFLKTTYKAAQYFGAVLVTVGLAIVLLPSFENSVSPEGSNVVVWSFVLVLSCVPMCLSSVYKEKAIGDTSLDAVYLNGWVAWFQFWASFPLLVPLAPATGLTLRQVPMNMWNGLRCLVGINSVFTADPSNGLVVDDCSLAPAFVWIYIAFNLAYNVLIILIIKYGSSNILWLSMTIMVPLGNMAFALPFVPGHVPLTGYDIAGLVIIMSGLLIYRFYKGFGAIVKRVRVQLEWTPRPARKPKILQSESPLLATPVRSGFHTARGARTKRKR